MKSFVVTLFSFFFCFVTVASQNGFLSHSCNYQQLPESFDTIGYLEIYNEFHAHSSFRVNTSNINQKIKFSITQPTAYRIYAAPHEVDVDLWINNEQTEQIVAHSSLGFGTEEVVYGQLESGSYNLELIFFGSYIGDYDPTDCDLLAMEIAFVPVDIEHQRVQKFTCPAQANFPTLPTTLPVDYSSKRDQPSIIMNARTDNVPQNQNAAFLHRYDFEVPVTATSGLLWEVQAHLGYDFLTSGSLGLLLTPNNQTEEQPDITCYLDSTCTLGQNSGLNEISLEEVVSPGKWTLWIYDYVKEKDTTLSTCMPFTFDLKISEHQGETSFLTCSSAPVPTSFEFFQSPGHFHFSQDVLIEAGQTDTHTILFNITQKSFFRAYLFHESVDLDISLSKSDGTAIATSYALPPEDGIFLVLEPQNNLQLEFSYWGVYEKKFCQTFHLEIALEPVSIINPENYCSRTHGPDLTMFQSSLFSPEHSFILEYDQRPYEAPLTQDPVFLREDFTLQVPSAIKIEIGSDFVLNGAEIVLMNQDAPQKKIGMHRVNRNYLATYLAPGNYTFLLQTGPTQRETFTDPSIPTCLQYSLFLEVMPEDDSLEYRCKLLPTLPNSLDLIQYLGTTHEMHIQDTLGIPTTLFTEFSSLDERVITFDIEEDSFLRVYIEPHYVDIDLWLFDINGNYLTSGLSWNQEEEIGFILRKDQASSYKLIFRFFRPEDPDSHQHEDPCFTYNMELSITPVQHGLLCHSENLPPTDFIPSYGQGSTNFYNIQEFQFNQRDTSDSNNTISSLNFEVESNFIFFRALVEYDFVWSDLTLRLFSRDERNTLTEIGINRFNWNTLDTVLLAPGAYTLEIYEPLLLTREDLAELSHCVSFRLAVGYETAPNPDIPSTHPNLAVGCEFAPFPTQLNSVEWLSDFSGQRVLLERPFLASTSNGRDETLFTLEEESLVTVFVPRHASLDIDLALYDSQNNRVINRNGYVEETFSYVAQPGSWRLSLVYYGTNGPLPPPSSCPSFPLQLSISPTSHFNEYPILESCQPVAPPATLLQGYHNLGSFSRALTINPASWSHTFAFEVTEEKVLLDFDLWYDGLSGNTLSLDLTGQVTGPTGEAISSTWYSVLGINTAYFHVALPTGSYQLTVHDPFPMDTSRPVLCGPFAIAYSLNITHGPSEYCETTALIPTDFNDQSSVPYGGPQAADGTVRIYGSFAIDVEQRNYPITFKVVEDSFIRVWANQGPETDVDLFLYNDINMTSGSLLYSSSGVETVESAIWKVDSVADNTQFLLRLFFYTLPLTIDCPQLDFEFALKTATTVAQELECPTEPFAPPPPFFYFDRSNSMVWRDSDDIFESSLIRENTDDNTFTYRITLMSEYDSTLVASVGYDFLANDFELQLLDSQNRVVGIGASSPDPDRSTYTNFWTLLTANLTGTPDAPNTYYLEIKEDLSQKELTNNLEDFCHRFNFFLATLTDGEPTITYVFPSTQTDLDPREELTLTVGFSQEPHWPQDTPLLDFLTNNHIISLVDASSPDIRISPSSAVSSTRWLTLHFPSDDFVPGKTYHLIFAAEQIPTSGSLGHFSAPAQDFSYTMKTCFCNNRGTCAHNSIECMCDPAYTGAECDKCNSGYHPVGADCQANEHCQTNSCNMHGTCIDTKGYIDCQCDLGYASRGTDYCSACASGYTGFPDCSPVDPGLERGPLCRAPLFPNNLNGPAYLEYNDEIFLHDNYYLDLDRNVHLTTFTLSQESVFRAYAQRHQIDIDLWLFDIDENTQESTIIDYGASVNDEDLIFTVLPPSEPNHHYELKFVYYLWDTTTRPTRCETANFALAIRPTRLVRDEAALFHSYCLPNNVVPVPNGWNAHDNTTFHPIADNWVFDDKTTFSVKATSQKPNYFYSLNFEIKEKPGYFPSLHAEIGYRYLIGDLALLLERGNQQTHCKDSASPEEDVCISGTNDLNTNFIHGTLEPGFYSLWLYEPAPQNLTLTQCAPFIFSMKVDYVEIVDPVVSENENCHSYVRLPETLNQPGLLDYPAQKNWVHFNEEFSINPETQNTISFTLLEDVVFRVRVLSDQFPLLLDLTGQPIEFTPSYEPEIVATLEGQAQGRAYNLTFLPSFIDESIKCPTINVQLMMYSTSLIVPHNCPSQNLPVLPNIRVPYQFGVMDPNDHSSPKIWNAYSSTPVITEYSWVVDQTAFFEVSLGTLFLGAGLKLELRMTSGDNIRIFNSLQRLNQHFIRTTLEPGSYHLRILRDISTIVGFSPCASFEFSFNLQPYRPDEDFCLMSGEAIPNTLNSLRWLGKYGTFNYQGSFRIPEFEGFYSQSIDFKVTNESIFRVFSEPHAVDIDLLLYEGSTVVENGGFGFNNEESIVYIVKPGKFYSLVLNMWKWQDDIQPCQEFNLQFAVGRTDLIHLPPKCPGQGSSHFPSFQLNGATAHYDSIENGETLWVQENTQEEISNEITFSLHAKESELRAFLGYEFTTSDLFLVLTDGSNTWYGDNIVSGNFLYVPDLPKASYTLIIRQTKANPVTIGGCLEFSFSIDIAPAEPTPYPRDRLNWPQDLNALPYLFFIPEIQLSGFYTIVMNNQSDSQMTSLRIQDNSLVRINTDHFLDVDHEIFVVLYKNNELYAASSEGILEQLAPGDYSVEFRRPFSSSPVSQLPAFLQFAAEPTGNVLQAVSSNDYPPASCATTQLPAITFNPQGYYHYNHDMLLLSQADIQNDSLPKLDFTLSQSSTIFAKIGFHYLLTNLELKLEGTFAGEKVTLVGTNYRNSHDLYETLPAGKYTLSLTQPNPFNFTQINIPHCSVYSLNLIIQAASDGGLVDCSHLQILPWDLNNQTGGSVEYGGPMGRAGTLHMFGEGFLIPFNEEPDSIRLGLRTSSLVSVVLDDPSGFNDIQSLFSTDGSIGQLYNPVYQAFTSHQSAKLFRIDHAGANAQPEFFRLELIYDLFDFGAIPCPEFALQMDVQPFDQIKRSITCPATPENKMPQTTIVQSTQNPTYVETFSTTLSPNNVLRYYNTTTNRVEYPIHIQVTTASVLSVSASFNSLVSLFSLTLESRASFASGEFKMQQEESAFTNLNAVLSGPLLPGDYVLYLTEQEVAARLPNQLFPDLRTMCLPFAYSLQLTPAQTTIVSQVSPPLLNNVPADKDLELSITFSGTPYFSGSSDISENIRTHAFALKPATNEAIFPSIAVLVDNHKAHWKLIWTRGQLQFNTQYTLQNLQQLQDAQRQSIVYGLQNTYSTIDSSCNHHGEYDNGICFCENGYAGRECNTCDVSYRNVGENGNLVCKKITGANCVADSCGCDPRVTDTCQPLGKCTEGDGSDITCQCFAPFAGDHCEKCQPGYTDWDSGCVKIPVCPTCIHGTCSDQTNFVCQCDSHWSGNSCDECAQGWSGSDCNTVVNPPKPPSGGKNSSDWSFARILGLIISLIFIIATVALIIFKYIQARRQNPKAFSMELPESEDISGSVELED